MPARRERRRVRTRDDLLIAVAARRRADGFLVDGVTGLVWRFDESKKAFVEVTRKPAEEKLPLITAVWEAQIQAVRKQYEAQLINTLSPELRDQAIKDFEKRFLKPIRDSAGLGT